MLRNSSGHVKEWFQQTKKIYGQILKLCFLLTLSAFGFILMGLYSWSNVLLVSFYRWLFPRPIFISITRFFTLQITSWKKMPSKIAHRQYSHPYLHKFVGNIEKFILSHEVGFRQLKARSVAPLFIFSCHMNQMSCVLTSLDSLNLRIMFCLLSSLNSAHLYDEQWTCVLIVASPLFIWNLNQMN